MSTEAVLPGRTSELLGEAAKLPAFLRRDLLVAWSYRMAFFSDFANLAAQMLLFFYIGKLVPREALPSYGGVQAGYLEFVTLGIVINVFVQVALTRMADALRQEQMIGTLEALLVTPTATATLQLGSAVFDLVYMPIRTAVFLGFMVLFVGIELDASGMLPSAAILLAFIPFVWGLGIASAAAILTFKRGSGFMGLGALLLGLTSGAFFPLALLPGWIAAIAEYNPLAIAIDGLREALLGGTGWAGVGHDVALLLPMSTLALLAGSILFRLALQREQRRGTLGLY
jgi:ABC-2 type transport system permease protein